MRKLVPVITLACSSVLASGFASAETVSQNFEQSSMYVQGSGYYYSDQEDNKSVYMDISPRVGYYVSDGLSVSLGATIYSRTDYIVDTKDFRYAYQEIDFGVTKWFGHEGLTDSGLVYKAGIYGSLGSWKTKDLVSNTELGSDSYLSVTPYAGVNYFMTPRASFYANIELGTFDLLADVDKFDSYYDVTVGVSYYISNRDKIAVSSLTK